MAVIKSKQSSNYTVVPNAVFNSGLSIEAIGLLTTLLSYPHDWVVTKKALYVQLNLGKERLDRVFKELQTKGYIQTSVEYNTRGKGAHYNHVVFDQPQEIKSPASEGGSSGPGFQVPENKPTENPPLISNIDTKETSTKKTTTKETTNSDTAGPYQLCIEFWLKDFHPDFIFEGIHGKKMKSIISKIEKLIKDRPDQNVPDVFKYICRNLPEWYRDKDLSIIDQKFNEIIQQIKNAKSNRQQRTIEAAETALRNIVTGNNMD